MGKLSSLNTTFFIFMIKLNIINWVMIIFKIFIPLIFGILVSILTDGMIDYDSIAKPSFYPPDIIFPIVWTILYLLMGISGYIISKTKDEKGLLLFRIQLLLNLLWPFVFSENYLIAFILIITLIIVVGLMLIEFSRVNKLAFYLQIPYFIWLIFAAILNFSIYLLN